jgi:hypothetical protein
MRICSTRNKRGINPPIGMVGPQQTLEKAQNRHQPLIQRLRTRSLRGTSRNNQVTLHVILLGVGGTIYNLYTITPLLNLRVPTH